MISKKIFTSLLLLTNVSVFGAESGGKINSVEEFSQKYDNTQNIRLMEEFIRAKRADLVNILLDRGGKLMLHSYRVNWRDFLDKASDDTVVTGILLNYLKTNRQSFNVVNLLQRSTKRGSFETAEMLLDFIVPFPEELRDTFKKSQLGSRELDAFCSESIYFLPSRYEFVSSIYNAIQRNNFSLALRIAKAKTCSFTLSEEEVLWSEILECLESANQTEALNFIEQVIPNNALNIYISEKPSSVMRSGIDGILAMREEVQARRVAEEEKAEKIAREESLIAEGNAKRAEMREKRLIAFARK